MGTRLPRTPAPLNQWGTLGQGIHLYAPSILCVPRLLPPHRTGTSTRVLTALAPGKFIFGLSPESRAWPRLHAKHPHFLPLTASLLYHKLCCFIFFSTHKGCSHQCLQHHQHRLPLGHWATGPPDYWATRLIPASKSAGFCTKHTEVSANLVLPPTK